MSVQYRFFRLGGSPVAAVSWGVGALILGAALSLAAWPGEDAESQLHAAVSRTPQPALSNEQPDTKVGEAGHLRKLEGKDAADLVKNFDRASVYPASVRLLLPNQHHYIEPDRYEGDWETIPFPSLVVSDSDRSYALGLHRQGMPLAAIRQQLLEKKGFERVPRYRITVADNNLSPGETLAFTLEVTDETGMPLRHTIRNAVVHADAAHEEEALGTARVSEAHTESMESRVEWKAPSADRRYWGDLRLDLELALGDGQVAKIAHFFHSTPHEVARFTSKFEERMSHGSLQIHAGVHVKERSQCTFSVLLYDDARNQPVARATHVDVLDPGLHEVPFGFYGKVLHDAKFAAGTLSLRQLRGECTRPRVLNEIDWNGEAGIDHLPLASGEATPERAHLPTLAMAYRTERKFHLAEFTDKPWDSADKRRYREILTRIQESREQTELSDLRLPPER